MQVIQYVSNVGSPLCAPLRGTSPLAIFLTVCLFAGLAAPVAFAQELNLASDVTSRVAPESDALGIKLGGFTAYPKLGLSGGYDSNIYAEPDDRAKSDGVFVIDPSLAYESNWSRNRVSLGGFLSQSLQAQYSQEDHTDWGVGGFSSTAYAFHMFSCGLSFSRQDSNVGLW